jgi:pimeloyl-ACP methyl ester carboxylesterase
MAACIAGALVAFVPGTGHWIHMDRPDVFNPLMDEFLAPWRNL